MTEAYIGLGGNIGDAVSNIKRAYELLSSLGEVSSSRLSPLYRSAPIGFENQEWFYNAVAELQVECSCRSLLNYCLEIEQQMKRIRKERWGPRTIDLDIIAFGDSKVNEEGLVVPHPRAHERAFVLFPLRDLNPKCELVGRPVVDWCETVSGQEIEKVNT